jgi:hydrophobic/amphiphilic exporter-1 (mainly G- bacteria), HAE1 family
MLAKFIERPVLATVISILLVILGVLGLVRLPLQQFPDIAPPAVQVSARYPGANAETILRSVAPSLEEAINGVENMIYMSSMASNDGTLGISVFFKQGTDPDIAAVNVQNRVAQAISQLPAEVIEQGITTAKQQNSLVEAYYLASDDESTYDQTFMTNYALINLIPAIKRVPGVGQVVIWGSNREYAMRVWLNPTQMAAYAITPKEVMAAIQDKNLEAAPGRFGEQSQEAFEYIIKYKGKFSKSEDYENIILRANADGSVLRLKDIARVKFEASAYNGITRVNGKPAINIGIFQQPGSNSNDIQIRSRQLMDEAAKSFPKGISYKLLYSTKEALDESIDQVLETLVEAFVLVFLVVYLFLQDFRATLIPAIAVPVAITGTFFFIQLLGFSINLLTLFALILVIGIVVDDAIVVVEAVHTKLSKGATSAKEATREAMREITGAIISITLVMAAVFIPIGFIESTTGQFYRQFAFTMAIAIVLSAVNALTLSPALAAIFLKPHATHAGGLRPTLKQRFDAAFNRGFEQLTNRYLSGLRFLFRRKWISITGLALILVATVWIVKRTPTGFIPPEDQGFIVISITLPAGASLERGSHIADQIYEALGKEQFSRQVNVLAGYNLLSRASSSSSGTAFVGLKSYKDRGPVKNIDVIQSVIREKLSRIKGAQFFVFTFPTVPGFSNVEGLDFVLQDRAGGSLAKFSEVGQAFLQALLKRPEIGFAFTPFRTDYPQLEVEVDDVKAAQLGVNVRDILQSMEAYFGTAQASDFNRFGKYYRVMLQAAREDRTNPSALDGVLVKNVHGEMVPLNTLVKLKRVFGPETADRYNLFNSISINAIVKPDFSSGDGINAVREVAAQTLPAGYSFEFTGQTLEETAAGNQAVIIFFVCLLFVYLLLAAQYESYLLPLPVILSIPTGVFGVFAAIGLTNMSNNIYVQVALIMLIGLLAKNAILIVEFAAHRRKTGEPIATAAIEAARSRLRPIIMTSLAFVVGIIPMMLATGPSAQGNHSISVGAAGGMVAGVLLGVFIVPVLFIVFQRMQERISKKPPAPVNA